MAGDGRRARLGIGSRILVGMLAGAAAGAIAGPRIEAIEPVGQIFIRLLMAAAIPLVIFNLLAGLTTLTELATFGRLALKIVLYYTLTTIVALSFGLAAATLLRPGERMRLTEAPPADVGAVPSIGEVLVDLMPANVFQALAEGKVGQLVVFSVLVGVTTLLLPPEPRDRLRAGYALGADLFRKLVDLVLRVAPYGIGALMAVTVGRYGTELFGPLARFLASVWGAQAVMVLVYMTLLRLLTARRPLAFLRQGGELWATTVATTSSLASLPVAFDVAEKMGLPRGIYSLTLPLGAQINKDGTSIMLSSVLLFTAQAAGVAFTPASIVTILLIGLILSEGSGGLPGTGLVVALIFVQAFNLPLEIAAIVGGIYRLVDMGNTTINVMGDLVGTAIVAQSEARRANGAVA
jgi:Na+/H+-dicarboxylate symporter